jgi:hypothetical protein
MTLHLNADLGCERAWEHHAQAAAGSQLTVCVRLLGSVVAAVIGLHAGVSSRASALGRLLVDVCKPESCALCC